jgi:hypothetical protein
MPMLVFILDVLASFNKTNERTWTAHPIRPPVSIQDSNQLDRSPFDDPSQVNILGGRISAPISNSQWMAVGRSRTGWGTRTKGDGRHDVGPSPKEPVRCPNPR